jgi:hypothetical protein
MLLRMRAGEDADTTGTSETLYQLTIKAPETVV